MKSIAPLRAPALLALLTVAVMANDPRPPVAARKPHTEVRHGETVTDDYFWLREKSNPEVAKYLEAENSFTEAQTLDLKLFSEALYKEMLGRIKQTDLSVPTRRGEWFYYSRTVEGQQYPIHCRRHGSSTGIDKNAKEEILLDQNELAKGKKFLDLGSFDVSDNGKKLMFTTDDTGFRQYKLFIKDLDTGAVSPVLAERVTSVQWASDNATAFLATEDAATKRSDSLWRMDSGAAPEKVYEEKDELYRISVGRTKDRKFVTVTSSATDSTEIRYLDSAKPKDEFKIFLPREKGHKYRIDHREGLFYIRTNKGAKNYRMVTAPDSDISPIAWKEFIPHEPAALLQGVELFKDYVVATTKSKGLVRFRVLSFAKGQWHNFAFPEEIYAAFSGGNPEYDSKLLRYSYQSPVTPNSVYDYDMGTRKRALLKQTEVLGGFDATKYACKRFWAEARDGVKVPLSVVYRKGIKLDGKNPLWLYAYGSYGSGMSATFSSNNLSLLDRGVVFTIAHIRGGNEMGEAWHDDGMLMKKMNTFTDFIDSAEWLIANKWTSKAHLVIQGGSAGGLLMGAVTNMRPELFKAVHAAAPFMDVMNSMLDATLPLTVGEYLEWGNPNEKAAYGYMKSYSPYDNIEKKNYPAILVTTSLNDSQVMYWEPAKYVAKLRALKIDSNPLLLRCKMDPAGHSGASGRYDALKDRAFEMAWMLGQMGIKK